MEREAKYVTIGVIYVTLLFGAFIFVVWLANFQFNENFDKYRIYFKGPVSGLSVGGEVQFNGIKVGEITRIVLDERDPNLVLTDIQVTNDTPVRMDSTARAVTQGITGVKYVQISPGSVARPLLRKVSREHPPVIIAERGKMEDLVNDLSKAANGGAEALARVNRLLSDANIASISSALGDVASVTAELKSHKAMFAKMDSALTKVDVAAGDFQATIASARSALGNKDRGALAEMVKASAEMNLLMAKLNGSASELSSNTIPEMTAALVSVQQASQRLDSLMFEIEKNPGLLLSSKPDREVEIPQ
jgi:phospholipid/cholesterol/gamma-HCH transport system substrate-binding protein